MLKVFKEEKLQDDDWEDVFHLTVDALSWFVSNVKSEAQIIAEGGTPISHKEASHTSRSKQKD